MNKRLFSLPKIKKPTSLAGCPTCGLYKDCKSPKMEATGEGRKGILVIAEAPGKMEDERGKQLLGEAGQYLRRILKTFDIDLDEDCRKINAINCRPPKNREPSDHEINICRSRVWDEIEQFKPKMILLLGGAALKSFLGHRWRKNLRGISTWRGWTIPDRDVEAWVCPTYHPSYVLRTKKKQPVVEKFFIDDIERAVKHSRRRFPSFKPEESKIRALTLREAGKALESLADERPELISFDYEATGLKPHARGHEIVCCSISKGPDEAFSFMWDEMLKKPFMEVMTNPRIGKTAHNLKFEDMWTSVRISPDEIQGWKWCSMTAAHILDNREYITGLKFQVYVHFGIIDYDSSIQEYLISDKGSANNFNNIHDAPEDKLLLYCGFDAMYGHRLTLKQMNQMPDHGPLKGYDLFHHGLFALKDMERNGFCVDLKHCKTQHDKLTKKIKTKEQDLKESKLAKVWKERYGSDTSFGSDSQLAEVLYEQMGIEPAKYTDKDNPSVDQDALEKTNVDGINELLDIRKFKKTRDTYLSGLVNESVAGKVYPFFHLNFARSYRSSSSDPNWQNMPVRDPLVRRMVRKAIMPSPGNQILEIDYSGIEVGISCCYHEDPVMITYVTDKSTDMHRDMAMQCYMLREDEVEKMVRFYAKNGFVFPQFYGDYYGNCATALWDAVGKNDLRVKGSGKPMKEHLKDKSIRSYQAFEKHIKKVEQDFWERRFKVYARWKKKQVALYNKHGYVEMLTGFRCTDLLDDKQVVNRPIQGSAFHCLLWSLVKIRKRLRKPHTETKLIGQIHDSGIMDAHPPEVSTLLYDINQITTVDLLKEWDWIIVPLEIEAEITPIDKPWYYKEEVAI